MMGKILLELKPQNGNSKRTRISHFLLKGWCLAYGECW